MLFFSDSIFRTLASVVFPTDRRRQQNTKPHSLFFLVDHNERMVVLVARHHHLWVFIFFFAFLTTTTMGLTTTTLSSSSSNNNNRQQQQPPTTTTANNNNRQQQQLPTTANMRKKSNEDSSSSNSRIMTTTTRSSSIRVAHLGNSIQYYNDCPRLLEHLLKESQKYTEVEQDSCLRGGATLASLWTKGNGMRTKFAAATPPPTTITTTTSPGLSQQQQQQQSDDIGSPTVEALLLRRKRWDFVILNDHTQSPARPDTKQESLRALKDSYVPLLLQHHHQQQQQTYKNDEDSSSTSPVVVIFLMTAAYRNPVKNSEDLGTFDEFTETLRQGYDEYARVVPNAKVAPVGLAYQYVRNHHMSSTSTSAGFSIISKADDEDICWEGSLYAQDDFHPSPHGTLLQAYVLYATMIEEAPPTTYDPKWWDSARYMQPPNTDPLPLPTEAEARILRRVACQVCQIEETNEEEKQISRL
jgi:hypothetical protein